MPRVELVRNEVQQMLKSVPFHPFALNLENGDRIIIEHPENIAFGPAAADGSGGSQDFYVLSEKVRFYGPFEAVTSVAVLVRGESAM